MGDDGFALENIEKSSAGTNPFGVTNI
jgi:hypothetical protein